MEAIKAYRPAASSLGSGQVLREPYTAEKAKLALLEMADQLALELVDKGLVTDQITVTLGYDVINLTEAQRRSAYRGEIVRDGYGRPVPKPAHGTGNLDRPTSSSKRIVAETAALFDRIADADLLVRRLNVTCTHVRPEADSRQEDAGEQGEQMDIFTDYEARQAEQRQEQEELAREKDVQQALLRVRAKFGKNAIFKGMDLEEGATTRERNTQIGGHKA